MRHFIVRGFPSNSRLDAGEVLHVGGDRGEAIAITNKPEAKFVRKEMYELARPNLSRFFGKETESDQDANDSQTDSELTDQDTDPDAGDLQTDSVDQDADDSELTDQEADSQTDSEPVDMTDSARSLAEEFDLTAEQIAEIKPSGTTGKILKDDVEDYIESLGTD